MILVSLFSSIPQVYAGEYDDLEQYGFRLVTDNEDKLHLQHLRGKDKYIIISKKRFNNSYEATQFCINEKMPNSGLWNALLLAMSGVSTKHSFIKESISFDFPEIEASGIWSWSTTADDTVSMMFDGRGTDTIDVPISKIEAALNKEVTLPAICSTIVLKELPDFN